MAEATDMCGEFRLSLTDDEVGLLNRLLYSHVGGNGRNREVLTDRIGAALRAAYAPMAPRFQTADRPVVSDCLQLAPGEEDLDG